MKCALCGTEFEAKSRARMYCSSVCKNKAKNLKSLIDVVCKDCGVVFKRSKWDLRKNRNDRCWSCKGREEMNRPDWSGSKSPTWLGGHKHWQAGKLGRDKDGLSWKQQRQLCWDRDRGTCQRCGDKKRKPDCHHIVPYRISKSHALGNLISLCKSCHKKADEEFKHAGVVLIVARESSKL